MAPSIQPNFGIDLCAQNLQLQVIPHEDVARGTEVTCQAFMVSVIRNTAFPAPTHSIEKSFERDGGFEVIEDCSGKLLRTHQD